MNAGKVEVRPGIILDARRALFLEKESALAIADLHLGYVWAHRYHGQLLPVGSPDDWNERITALCRDYQPARLILVGDIIHQTVPVAEIRSEFEKLAGQCSSARELVLIQGNHDRKLGPLVTAVGLTLKPSFETDECLFMHGDQKSAPASKKTIVMGHEHPAISLGDGVSTSAKFPCFLISRNVIILPAFSLWAAGTNVRAYEFMSPIAKEAHFTRAIAILGQKLLPVAL